MKIPRRLPFTAFAAAATLTVAFTSAQPAAAQTAVTDPVGFYSLPLPANSDTYVSIPFTRATEFTGSLSVAPAANGNVLTFSGSPFTSGQFVPLATAETAPFTGHKTYYVFIGPKNVALTPTLSVTQNSTAVTASAALPADFLPGDTVTVGGHTFTATAVSGTSLTLNRAFPDATPAAPLTATYNHSPNEGRFYTVSTNDTGTLTVNLNGDSLSNVAAGTRVSVIPYWTLGSAFPNGQGISPAAGFNPGTQIYFPDTTTRGINTLSVGPYVYSSSLAMWIKAGPSTDATDYILYPDNYLIARQGGTATTFTPVGSVAVSRLSVPLSTNTDKKQDNFVSITRPAAVTLNDSGLVSSGAFTPSTGFVQKDLLMVYDNSVIKKNKLPSATYIYVNGQWVDTNVAGDAGATLLQPGTGIVIRKATNSTGGTTFWVNSPNYLN